MRYIFSSKSVFYISLIMFRLLLDLFYILFVNKFFEYTGFILDFNIDTYVFSWLIYIISFGMVQHYLKKISDYFFVTSLLNIIAPLTSMYGLAAKNFAPVLITILSLFFVYIITKLRTPFVRIVYFKGAQSVAVFCSIFLVFYLIVWYVMSGAANNINFKFSEVYNYRAGNAVLTNIGVLAYLNSWIIKIFNIFLIAYSLYKRFYILFFIFITIQVFFYGVSAHKSILFLPVLVVGIWFYFRRFNQLIILPIMFSVVLCGSYLFFIIFDDIMLPSMFIRRVFFVPAHLAFAYFDFFSTHKYILWSNSILSNVFNYSYDLPLGKLIGDYLGSKASANNGYISSGYAHAGVWGVLIYSVILGFVLKLINHLARSGIPLWFALAITIVPLRSLLISSDLFTVMLTHGLIISILLLIMMRIKTDNATSN